jgi:hypothetical protein
LVLLIFPMHCCESVWFDLNLTSSVVIGLELFSMEDNLPADTMLFGVFTLLSRFTILTVFCLDFLVICMTDLNFNFLLQVRNIVLIVLSIYGFNIWLF